MSALTFTDQELQQQAQGNAIAFLLVTLAYLKQNGGSIADWTRFAGQALAPGWSEAASADALQLGRIWALNFVSTGGTLESFDGDAQQAEGIVSSWPADDALAELNLTREDIDQFLAIGPALTATVGARFTWSRSGDRITYVITR